MALYYKIQDPEDVVPLYEGFHFQKVQKANTSGPLINYDFSKHVLIELLDNTTPESRLWNELGLSNNKNVVHKRLMIDTHRINCRRAVIICNNSEEAIQVAAKISQTKVMDRCVCAVVIKNLLSDLCLFEKQVIQCDDNRSQQQLLYVSDLSRSRGTTGLVKFLREKFSPFGTILSILVCPGTDGYAFPEGVIKFSYLSEAFAAELAFDQYVIGKERLSVSVHHNILLSLCDLRTRLRDAQWCYNIACSEPDKSCSFNQMCEVNNLHPINNVLAVNSIDKLEFSGINDAIADETNMKQSDLEDIFPAFSQFNFETTSAKIDCNEKTPYNSQNKINERLQLVKDLLDNSSKNGNVLHNIRTSTIKSNIVSDSANNTNQELMECTKIIPVEVDGTQIVKHENRSKNNQSKRKLNIEKLLDDSEINEISLSKDSTKRRTKYTPSLKLSLKHQRVGLSQNSIENTSASEISDPFQSQQEKLKNDILVQESGSNFCSVSEDLKKKYFSGSQKVADWLLHNLTANMKNRSLEHQKQNLDTENTNNEKPVKNKMVCRNKISVFEAPSLKSNQILFSDKSFIENEDPNINPKISSGENNFVPVMDKSENPLQFWLKKELTLSINNSIIKLQDATKNSIVCATRTKDVVISVGCSHIVCESCYPESTDLLLGYS